MLTLPTSLKMQPALRVPLLLALGIAELVLLIVRLEQVLDDGAALPDLHARGRVFDGWDAAVGVDGLEGVFFEVGEVHELGFVGDAEFFEEDGDLPAGVLVGGSGAGAREATEDGAVGAAYHGLGPPAWE